MCLHEVMNGLCNVRWQDQAFYFVHMKLWIAESAGSSATADVEQTKCESPYGARKSPLTAEFVSGSSKLLEGSTIDSDGRLL